MRQWWVALHGGDAVLFTGIMELSFPRTFAPKSESTIGGTFAPWYFRSLELSPLYQYEKRITVALSTTEYSSLSTNVALQSVLASRQVRLTYDAG